MDPTSVDFLSKVFVAHEIEEVYEKETTLNTGEDHIKFFLGLMFNRHIIPRVLEDKKDAKLSEVYRKQGNRLSGCLKPPVTEDRCVAVLKHYTKSIAYAPYQSKQLAVAYANRSKILYDLNKYESCAKDIDRALALKACPADLRFALYTRKIESLLVLQDPKAKDTLEEARCWLQQTYPEDVGNKTIIEWLSTKCMKMQKSENEQDATKRALVRKIEDPSPEAPCSSDMVKIAYNEEYGRHLVATRDIQPGDLLIAEKPYSMMFAIDKMYSHCSHCLEMSWACIPCHNCASAVYCSEECRNTSWKQYHDIECAIFYSMSKISSKHCDISASTLRLTIQAVKEFASIEDLRKEVYEVDNCKDLRTKGFSANGVLTGDKYRNVLGLATNYEKRTKQDLFVICLHSCYMLYYLATQTNWFGRPLPVNQNNLDVIANNDDALFIGSLIMRHLQLIRINGNIVYEQSSSSRKLSHCGIRILPFTSLMNHSCMPNVIVKHKTKRETTSNFIVQHFAKDHIKADEQLFVCYSMASLRDAFTPTLRRQKILLENYHFKCNCLLCQTA